MLNHGRGPVVHIMIGQSEMFQVLFRLLCLDARSSHTARLLLNCVVQLIAPSAFLLTGLVGDSFLTRLALQSVGHLVRLSVNAGFVYSVAPDACTRWELVPALAGSQIRLQGDGEHWIQCVTLWRCQLDQWQTDRH